MLYFNDHNEKVSRLVNEGNIAEIVGISNDELVQKADELNSTIDQAANWFSDGSYEFTYEDNPIYA